MENKVIRECASFDHSLVFAKANGADIPPTSKGAGYVATLGNIYTQLVNAGATQKPITVSAQNALILALDQKLDNMAATARAYASMEPGFDDLFPRCAHLNPGEVLRTANAYLAKLAPAQNDDAATAAAKAARLQVFVDHGMASTLVADLQAGFEEHQHGDRHARAEPGAGRVEHGTNQPTGGPGPGSARFIGRDFPDGLQPASGQAGGLGERQPRGTCFSSCGQTRAGSGNRDGEVTAQASATK